MSDQTDVLQGTLDLLIMRTIGLEPHQGWITAEWGASENNRRARFYALTKAGRPGTRRGHQHADLWNALSIRELTPTAAVSLFHVLGEFAATREFHEIRKCFWSVYLHDPR